MVRRSAVAAVVVAIAVVVVFAGRHRTASSGQQRTDVPIVRASAVPAIPAPTVTTAKSGAAPAALASPAAAAAGSGIPDDPELEAAQIRPDMEPRALYRRLRAEPRDAAWAEQSERSLKNALASVPYVGSESVRVNCGSSICEAAGSWPENTSSENVNAAMQVLQGDSMRQGMERQGLNSAAGMFGGSGKRSTFVLYFTRQGR